jgi:phosphoserine aminotransferase
MTAAKPSSRPNVPHFSSGPCAKRPGWTLEKLSDAAARPLAPRQDRQGQAQARDRPDPRSAEVPADYRIGIVPASDTGAVEMALWSLLGARGVDHGRLGSFGEGWVTDVVKQLKLKDVTHLHAGYGELPDLKKVDPNSRRRLHLERHHLGRARADADWIADDREGLTICDATSAAFAQPLDWAKARCRHLLLAEGARRRGGPWHDHPVAARRRARLESYTPSWPLPKIFRMTKGGKLNEGIFVGRDHQHALDAVRRGLSRCAELGQEGRRAQGLIARADANTKVLLTGAKTPWIDFLAADPAIRAPTRRCA